MAQTSEGSIVSKIASRIPPDFPARWILCWLLLPTIVIILMWQVAAKPMQSFILMSGIAALIIAQVRSRAIRTIGAIVIFVMVSIFYVARLFGIPPLNLAVVAQFITEVRPLRSPEYAVAGLVLAALLLLVLRMTPNVERFHNRTQFLYAAVAIGLFAMLDASFSQAKGIGLTPPVEGEKVDSAVKQVGLAPQVIKGRNVLVILVEALGKPAASPERELCDTTTPYDTFDFSSANCLPERFVRAGYETTANTVSRPASSTGPPGIRRPASRIWYSMTR